MNSICLDVLSLFGSLQNMSYLSLGDTILVFVGDRIDIWSWVSNKGGWCLVVYEA